MTTRRSFLSLAGALIAGTHSSLRAADAQISGGTARMLVGFAPGGALDVVARVTVEAMKGYAPSFIVDNRPGAGGRVALDILRRSPGDGATMVLTPASMVVLYPHIYKKLGYDVFQDFAPVTPVCSLPFLLTVGPMVPSGVKTVSDFAAWCREHPKQASYGTAAAGSMLQFTGTALARAGGFEFVHLPYGGPGGIQDLAGGRLAATIYPFGTALPHVKAGLIRALATTGPQRNPALPEVPTMREAGFPTAEAVEWWGVLLPARTPAPQVESLNVAIREALQTAELKQSFEKLSVDAAGSSSADFARLIRADFERWAPVVRASGFTAEE
jgi:tripartite-type tricarboxylate transporter receptor subunit TctC